MLLSNDSSNDIFVFVSGHSLFCRLMFSTCPLRPYQVEWWEWCMEKFAADDSLTDCPPEKWTEAATAQVDTFLEENGLVFVDD